MLMYPNTWGTHAVCKCIDLFIAGDRHKMVITIFHLEHNQSVSYKCRTVALYAFLTDLNLIFVNFMDV